MNNFDFQVKTKIVFGKGAELQVGPLTKAETDKVLLHYGGGSIKRSGLYDKVIRSLEEVGVEVVELGGVVANPRVSLVREGIKICREQNIKFILAVGGGSVIDSAKAIAAGFYYEGDVWDIFMGKAQIEKTIPLATILTIPAAGSEVSWSMVITNEDGLLKKPGGHPTLRPVFSLLNPEWTFTLPAYQTACGITDMMAHVMERYFTNTDNVELTDRLCEAVMKTVVTVGPKLMADPDNYDLRAEIMWAGTNAHSDLVGTGREEDWATHDMEHEVSGIYDIAHGAGLAILFPAWMKYVYRNDIPRFAQWANRVFDIEINTSNLEETAIAGIEALEIFFMSIGMPTRLSDEDISTDRFEEMANKATDNDAKTLGSFVKLKSADIKRIYELAQ